MKNQLDEFLKQFKTLSQPRIVYVQKVHALVGKAESFEANCWLMQLVSPALPDFDQEVRCLGEIANKFCMKEHAQQALQNSQLSSKERYLSF